MTPQTLRIDRSFKGIGRISRVTGTTNPVLRRKMSRMLTTLYGDARLDILRAIRDGDLTLMEVFSAYQGHTLDTLPTAKTVKPLAEAMTAWIDSLNVPTDISKKHKESLETSRRYLVAAKKDATIADLPDILDALRESLGKDHPRSFNLARLAASRFVRAKFKRSHPLYTAIQDVEARPEPKATKRSPLTPDAMRGFFPHPETDVVDAMAWTMATTGMHAAEYWGRWHMLRDRVHIDGTKRGGRKRDVPIFLIPVVPAMHRRTFENKLRERTRAIVVYDLRRTYANWLESAGIPRTRRRLYLGHGEKDVTDLYEVHEVQAYLTEDAAKMQAFLNATPAKIHAMRLEKQGGAQ